MRTGASTGARGTAVGLVTAAGGAWAHHLSGGTVTAPVLLVAVLASVAAGVLLTRPHRLSPLRVLALAVATQGAWHLLLTATATPVDMAHMTQMAHGTAPGTMLLTHVAVALVSGGLALGADRALLRLARAALDRLRMPAPRHPSYDVTRVPLPVPVVRAPEPPAAGTAPVRGPPSRHALAPLAPAAA